MVAKRKCSTCPEYRTDVRRCGLGKINPPTIKGGIDAARFFGMDYICQWAKHKEKICQKMRENT